MTRTIQQFADGTVLEYATGRFDSWCIFLCQNGQRKAPKDIEYFSQLKELAKKYNGKIYQDFVKIYNITNSTLNNFVLAKITELATQYGNDALEMTKLFTILYAGMVAEENKKNAILKKRIKRLGIHQILLEDLEPNIAANFSRGKKWRELDIECKQRGF